jgi:predicted ATPase/DNA-binding winged helix-turn-helix (wHTH) protein
MADSSCEATEWLAFDAFLLFPGARQLKRDGRAISIGDRALDLLIALTERPGQVLSRVELAEKVWRRAWVEDVTIRVTVGMLRKVLGRTPLGTDYVINSLGRGYAFSGSVEIERWPKPVSVDPSNRMTFFQAGRLPALLKPVIGRAKDIEQITSLLSRHRLVTIVGPGGIGKTTTAISAVARLAERQGGVCFVDFGPIQDPALVPARIAAALGSNSSAVDPVGYAIDYLSQKQRLLVLDNCEHIATAAVEIVEGILQSAPRVTIVATSREPLRVDGEVVHRLDGLTYPSAGGAIAAVQAAGFSAVELFVERAQAALPSFALTDATAPGVVEICRRLDGIALAIQLAASRVPALGVAGVLSHLDDRLRLLCNGTRTAMPRHRTLEATFEWSFELLTPGERRLFTRLSVFCNFFTIDAAVIVAGWEGLAEEEGIAIVANLVDKSLIAFTGNECEPCYRMLETVRVFASARLQAAGEATDVAERHARHVIARCQGFRSRDPGTHGGLANSGVRDEVDDLRSALKWAFDVPGLALARDLIFAAIPLLTHLGLTFEFKACIARALESESDPRGRLALSIDLGKAVHLLQSEPITQSRLYEHSFEMAKELGDIPGALQALWGMAITGQAMHRPRQMIDAATQFYDFAVINNQISDAMVAECLTAFGLHDIGAFRVAEKHLLYVLARYSKADGIRDAQRYLFNYRALALSWLASVQWKTGRPGDAAKTVALAVAEAGHHVPSLFVTLSHAACPIALERSDWATAIHQIEQINRHCGHHIRWRHWADALSAILAIRRDRSEEALDRLDDLLSEKGNQFPGQHFWYRLELINGHLSFNHSARAESLTRSLLADLCDREEFWLLPEVVRALGAVGGEEMFDAGFSDALDLARRQYALYCDLRLGDFAFGREKKQVAQIGADKLCATDSWSSALFAYSRSNEPQQRMRQISVARVEAVNRDGAFRSAAE